MIYVYSTLSNDQIYTNYGASVNGVPKAAATVFIAGKANITTKHFVTPAGVVTEVTEEQLAELKRNPMFQLHEQNGFITYDQKKQDADKVAEIMTGRDESAPLVEQDFKEDEAPVVNKTAGRKARKG